MLFAFSLTNVDVCCAVQALVPRSSSVVLRRAADSLARVLQPGSPSALPASHRLSPFEQGAAGAKPQHSQVYMGGSSSSSSSCLLVWFSSVFG
jgi:hypothetical protein